MEELVDIHPWMFGLDRWLVDAEDGVRPRGSERHRSQATEGLAEPPAHDDLGGRR